MVAKIEHQTTGGAYNAWLVGVWSHAIPGGGHVWLKRFGGEYRRAPHLVNFYYWHHIGGHLYGSAVPPLVARLCSLLQCRSGLLYLSSWLRDSWPKKGLTLATSEYGNIYLISRAAQLIFAMDAMISPPGERSETLFINESVCRPGSRGLRSHWSRNRAGQHPLWLEDFLGVYWSRFSDRLAPVFYPLIIKTVEIVYSWG